MDVTVGWALRNWCFWTVVLEKTLESPLDCKEIQQSILKEINPEYSLEGLMLKFQYFATWCKEPTHWKKPWCWEKLKAGGEGDDRGRDGWMALLTQWTWVWATSGRWWRTGKPGMLQSMGSQSQTWLSVWKTTISTKGVVRRNKCWDTHLEVLFIRGIPANRTKFTECTKKAKFLFTLLGSLVLKIKLTDRFMGEKHKDLHSMSFTWCKRFPKEMKTWRNRSDIYTWTLMKRGQSGKNEAGQECEVRAVHGGNLTRSGC